MQAPRTPQIWVFDVDGTLIDSLTGSSLRPLSIAVLSSLQAAGHSLILWSAGGAKYARQRAIQHGIDHFFGRFAAKATRGCDGRYLIDLLPPGERSTTFVDDVPDDLPFSATVVRVWPYLSCDSHDRGLSTVLQAAGLQLCAPLEIVQG